MGDRAWKKLLEHHERVVNGEIDRWHGKNIEFTGDGVMATFDAPTRALRCAFGLVEAARGLDIETRAGIHTGEIERRETGIGGIAVHIAARVLGQADPSQVLVTKTVRDLVAGTDLAFRPLGDASLRACQANGSYSRRKRRIADGTIGLSPCWSGTSKDGFAVACRATMTPDTHGSGADRVASRDDVETVPDPIDITTPMTDEPVPVDWRANPTGWSDQLTGTDGPRMWDRVMSTETARVQRYHGRATIVLVELDGIDRYAGIWGADAAGRLFLQLARTLATEVRASDHIARLEPTRFAILLTETDEIAAINFVERARASCEKHIRTPELLRVALGWAGPTGSSDLRAAVGIAAERLTKRDSDAFLTPV